jgi:hypothetical protein
LAPQKQYNFRHLAILGAMTWIASFSLFANDTLTIESKTNSQKYCLDQWQNECGKYKSKREEFLKCTQEKTEPGCKSILTKLIKQKQKEQNEQQARHEASPKEQQDKFHDCNSMLHQKCPADRFKANVDQAKCFQQKFKELTLECRKAIVKYFGKKKTNNKKPGQ